MSPNTKKRQEKSKSFAEDFLEKWKKGASKSEVQKYKQILKNQEEILKENPKNSEVLYTRGNILAQMGNYEEALKCFNIVVKLDPKNKDGWNARANALSLLGRHKEAAASHKKALEPSSVTVDKELDGIIEDDKALEEIIGELFEDIVGDTRQKELAAYDKRVEDDPNDAEAWYERALVLSKMGDYRRAIDSLHRVTKLDVKYPNVWKTKGDLFKKLGDEKWADICYKRAREHNLDIHRCTICGNPVSIEGTICDKCNEDIKADLDDLLSPEEEAEELKEEPEVGHEAEPEVEEPEAEDEPEETWRLPVHKPEVREPLESDIIAPPKPPKPPELKRDEGLINGLVRDGDVAKKVGKINGLVNGMRTDKSNNLLNSFGMSKEGLTNGLTNGLGMTNGLGYPRFRKEAAKNKWKMIVIPLIAFGLIFTPFISPLESTSYYKINIDGEFSDWTGLTIQVEQRAQLNPNIDIVNVGVENNKEYLSFYIKTQGPILTGGNNLVDTFYIFIDYDLDYNTGYRINNLGADFLIEIFGKQGSVIGSTLSAFDETRNQDDWNGWQTIKDIHAASSINELETQVRWSALGDGEKQVSAYFYSQSYDKQQDFSDYITSNVKGVLEVEETGIAPEVIDTDNNKLLQIDLRALDTDIVINELNVQLLGTASSSDVNTILILEGINIISEKFVFNRNITFNFEPAIEMSADETKIWYIAVDIKNSNGNTLGVSINNPVNIKIVNGTVSFRKVASENELGYLGFVPTETTIDGGFSDWWTPIADNDSSPISNPDIDISYYDFTVENESFYFYLKVEGSIMNGSVVPYWNQVTGETPASHGAFDSDMDSIPDEFDPFPFNFDNQGADDNQTNNDFDEDGVKDYPYGNDYWLNTTILHGTQIPSDYWGREVNRYIGPVEQPSVVGEDVIRIYMETANNSGDGYLLRNQSSDIMYADYLLEIRGKNGNIFSRDILSFNGQNPGDWNWEFLMNIHELEKDYSQIEGRVDTALSGISPLSYAFIEMNDWDQNEDEIASSEMVKSVDIETTKASTLLELVSGVGTESGDRFGWNVSYAGDVNNDGYPDVIVGAPYNDTSDGSMEDAGAAYIFFGYSGIGSSNINAANANVSIYGENAGDHFGWSVSDLGNVGSETKDDIIIGAPGYNSSTVYIAWGSSDKKVHQEADANTQAHPEVVVDSEGNSIFVWVDSRGPAYDVYAQKLDKQGTPLWGGGTSDVRVNQNADSANYDYHMDIAVDSNDNVIVVWTDERNGAANLTIYAQKLNSNGVAQWGSSDVRVNQATSSANRFGPSVGIDPSNNAIIVWTDERNGDTDDDIYAQKLNSAGLAQWGSSDKLVNQATDTDTQDECSVDVDSNGYAVVAWHDDDNSGSGDEDIFAQRLDTDGTALWGSSDVKVNQIDDGSDQLRPAVGVDSDGNAIVVWQDERDGFDVDDIYAQKLNTAGVALWGSSDKIVNEETFDVIRAYPHVDVDPSGYAVAAWWDERHGSANCSIYAQRLNPDGERQWDSSDVRVNQDTGSYDREYVAVAIDNDNCAIITWDDERSGGNDVYAQKLFCEDAGRAYIFNGKASWSSSYSASAADDKIDGGRNGDKFGISVSRAGDVDNSNYNDIIVGAMGYNYDQGRAYVFYGDGSIPASADSADKIYTGETVGDMFGFSISNAGDVDNDGKDDVIIGAPYNDDSGTDAGEAYVYLGGDYYVYVTSNATTYGAISNFANAQSASDSGAYATLAEDDIMTPVEIFNETFPSEAAPWDGTGQDESWGVVTVSDPDDISIASGQAAGSAVSGDPTLRMEDCDDPWGTGDIVWASVDLSGYEDVVIEYYWQLDGTDSGEGFRSAYSTDSTNGVDGTWIQMYEHLDNPEDTWTKDSFDVPSAAWVSGFKFRFNAYATGPGEESFIDDVRIIGNSTEYKMDIEFNTTSVPPGTNYYLDLNYSVDGTETDFGVLVYDGSTWDDMGAQGDLDQTSFTAKSYTLNSDHRLGSGYVRVRFIGRNETSDSVNSTLNIEYHRIRISGGYLTLSGEAAGDMFGWSVGNTSDINQDGSFDDVIVGAPGYSSSKGRAYIFHGASSMDGTADLTLTGETSGDKFGFSVHGVGDIDDDGVPDVAVGAPYYHNGATADAGRIYLFVGGSSMDSIYDYYFNGTQANEHLGWSVSMALNVDGGSFNGIVIGAPHHDDGADTDDGETTIVNMIPEFDEILMPVVFVILIAIVFGLRRRTRHSLQSKKSSNG